MENLSAPTESLVDIGKTFSQFTYTLRSNGDWDNLYVYTDGTSTPNHGSIGRPARKGDIKHTEYVYRNNVWIQNVIQYY